MTSVYDQIERALDTVLDGLLNKTLRSVAWLVNPGDNQEVSPASNLPDIVKDIHTARMPNRDFQPDLLPIPATTTTNTTTTTYPYDNNDGVTKRCKSMNDICRSATYGCTTTNNIHSRTQHSGNTFPNQSFDLNIRQVPGSRCSTPPMMYRQESCPGETDIELEAPINNKIPTMSSIQRQCTRCCSDPLPLSEHTHAARTTPACKNFDLTDSNACGLIEKCPSLDSFETVVSTDNAALIPLRIPKPADASHPPEMSRGDLLIYKHFPDAQHTGELHAATPGDEQLVHNLISELKIVADNFDAGHHAGQNGMSEMQWMAKFFFPEWTRGHIVPTVFKTSLQVALQFYKL